MSRARTFDRRLYGRKWFGVVRTQWIWRRWRQSILQRRRSIWLLEMARWSESWRQGRSLAISSFRSVWYKMEIRRLRDLLSAPRMVSDDQQLNRKIWGLGYFWVQSFLKHDLPMHDQ